MASFSVPCPKVSPVLAASSHLGQKRPCVASFLRSGSRSNSASLIAQFQGCTRSQSDVFKVCAQLNEGCTRSQSDVFKVCAQLNEAGIDKGSQSGPKPDAMSKNSEDEYEVPDASSISTFMTQVMDLVKLVDSKDIVELELKQMDCEVLIRKKEALPQPSVAAPMFMPPPTYQAMQPAPLPSANSPTPAPVASAPAKPPAPVKPSSSHPPFKCPMAGNFYRSSAPGTPPFVKVGDKVQKGQVLCIIEAMKLMNEIEADTSGTVVEILVDDGKPVSVDLPLFIIEP